MANREGNFKLTSINGVKSYAFASQQQSRAPWATSKKAKSHRKIKAYTQTVEVIHDLRFETATTNIKATPDGEYLIASGIYPPQVKVYELRELGMKFERHLDSEIVDFQVLSDDYSKLAFLCADRSISLHAKYGKHYSLRIPRMGRDMAYDCWSCDLLCAASSPDICRINLEQGRFLSSLSTHSPALNVISRSKVHGLVACGGEDGAVECFDTRTRSSVGRLNVVASSGDVDQEVTALAFDGDVDFQLAVGSSAGKVLIYDLRSSHPMQIKDHMYGSPILDIKWHRTLNFKHPKLITSDKHVIRIWDPQTGEGMTSIEPTAGAVNDVCTFDGTGLMMLALDCSQIPAYFLPSLGPAPKWCSPLENMTEELEEGGESYIYDNYKFLTKEDLDKLNLTNLIGTKLLRANMHGFYIDYKLYRKAKEKAEPFDYEKYIEEKKRQKLEADLASHRITTSKRLPKVNRKLAQMLEVVDDDKVEDGTENDGKKSKKKSRLSKQDLEDSRFDDIFANQDFAIDENSTEYMALHPMASTKNNKTLLHEHFEPIAEEGDEDSDAPSISDPSDDENKGHTHKRAPPRLYEIKDEKHADAFRNNQSLAGEDALPLGDRVAALGSDQLSSRMPANVKLGPGGSREITFKTRSSTKYVEDKEDMEVRRDKRRGVQSLGLKPDRSAFGGRGRGRGRGRGHRGRGRGGRR